MKSLVACAIVASIAAPAMGAELQLQPFYPSPYAERSWYFSMPGECHLQSFDGTYWNGVCLYYGYGRNAQGYAVVQWDVNGNAVGATPCVPYSTCPIQSPGSYETVNGYALWVEGTDSVGNTGGNKTSSRIPVLVTP